MTWIIKRISGDREKFEAEKIRRAIKKAYLDAELIFEDDEEEVDGIVVDVINHFGGGEAVPSTHIRDLVTAKLEVIEPRAADAWKKYEKKHKKK